jgi:hypothetical protein
MSRLQKVPGTLRVAVLVALLAVVPAIASAETSITTSNSSDDTETTSGDATAENNAAAQAGHNGGGDTDVTAGDIENENATNVQEGDNDVDGSQSATSESGATVGGQVIGAVTDGALTIDATNSSTDVDVESGDATSTNDFSAFVGLDAASGTTVAADIINGDATNVQEGDNGADVTQRTDAVTGDAVAGQILGATSGGPTDIVLANTSEDTDATTGDSEEDSTAGTFTGLVATGIIEI